MSGTLYKGTTFLQDGRFKNKEKKLLEKKNYPKEYEVKIIIDKIELKVIRDWVEKNLTKILGFEDEFLVNFVMNLLENQADDPRKIELQLRGFLSEDTEKFMTDLWSILIQAQNSESGIPEFLLKEKEEELKAKSEKNIEKVKFLEKMLGEKETKFYPDKGKVENKEDNKEYKLDENSSKYKKVENKSIKNKEDRKSHYKFKKSDYRHTSKRRSRSISDSSRSFSRSRSINRDKKRRDKYIEEKQSRNHCDDKFKERENRHKRNRSKSYDKEKSNKNKGKY